MAHAKKQKFNQIIQTRDYMYVDTIYSMRFDKRWLHCHKKVQLHSENMGVIYLAVCQFGTKKSWTAQ